MIYEMENNEISVGTILLVVPLDLHHRSIIPYDSWIIYIFLLLCQKLYLYHTIELFHITPKSLSKLFAKEKLVAMWDMGNWRSYSIKHNKMGIFFYWYSSGKTLKRRQINEYWGIHTEGLSLLVRGHIRNQLCVYRQGHINWFQITFWVVYR